jgi:hypothetical protein
LKARLEAPPPHDLCAAWQDSDCSSVGGNNVTIAELRPTQATVGIKAIMA